MLEFFIGLFGSIYYGARLGSERRRKKAADARWEQWEKTRDQFIAEYEASFELMGELDAWVRDPKNFDEICWILHDELTSVHGESFRDKIVILSQRERYGDDFGYIESGIKDDGDWIDQLLLAKMGMIGFGRWFGFNLGTIRTKEYAVRLAYCKQIEENLIAHGVDTLLCVDSGSRFADVGGRLQFKQCTIVSESVEENPKYRLW